MTLGLHQKGVFSVAVVVGGTGTNLALNKMAYQSTGFPTMGQAYRAVGRFSA